ncbi:PAC2 family protein [Corynebacterium auriscanis]|uniref:PAC2 family protein n=1 Tax=Corynebacterium auriscanis TaxID=99807 RepID=UPI000A034D26|nr:PAC2 family protein [Corynebacterium auriscanis]MCX2162972.1 PAC2 family protein [Corynebacterium auriscanis]WJY72832.1 PAC2 family protein [Corynebacterium auriscanis]
MPENFPQSDGQRRELYDLAYPNPLGGPTPQLESQLNTSLSNPTERPQVDHEATDTTATLPLMIALQGYADAGQAVHNAGTHLLQALDSQPLAKFRVDDLVDYRSRRPGVTMDHSRVVDREELALTLDVVTDTEGQKFLLLSGPEPDLKWGAFSDAVLELARKFNVDRVVTLYAAPMTVPHTRPLVISAHSTNYQLTADYHTWDSRMILPGAAALDTELKLSRHGFETIGFTAHVPHYIAASDYPEATHNLLEAVSKVTGRKLPLTALESDIARVQSQLTEQVEESAEIGTVVQALEQQYDANAERIRRRKENTLLQPGQTMPTGDEIGAELEAFLANVARGETDGSSDAPEQRGVDPHKGAGEQPEEGRDSREEDDGEDGNA